MSTNFVKLYQIVPLNDGGYNIVCRNSKNQLYLRHKAAEATGEELVFSTQNAAEEWIKFYQKKNQYKVEDFITGRPEFFSFADLDLI